MPLPSKAVRTARKSTLAPTATPKRTAKRQAAVRDAPPRAVRRRRPVDRDEIRPDFSGVEVRTSKVHGRGLFAARDFRKGERIMEYGGVKLPKKEGERRTEKQWDQGRVYTFELSRRKDIDGSPRWNLARLANQSCDPNAESHNEAGRHIWIVALRPIRRGEEITYDYNFPMTEPPPKCRCGSPKCRGYIVGEDHVAELRTWLKAHGKKGGPGLRGKGINHSGE